MLRKYYCKEKIHINFLYSNQQEIKKIKEQIIANPIDCEQEYLEKCIKVRDLFLKRIDDMTESIYYSYRDCFKYINSGTHIYIDNLITLLEQDDITLKELVNNEKNNYNYYYIIKYKENNNLNDDDVLPVEISIALLDDIYNRMLNIIRDYAYKLVVNNYFEHNKKQITDIIDDEFTYHITISILKEKLINEFSYLEKTLYNDIYQKILNNLNKEFNNSLKLSLNHMVSLEKQSCRRDLSFIKKKK